MSKESKFSKRHYEAIADVLSKHFDDKSIHICCELVCAFAKMFVEDNAAFDKNKFYLAATKRQARD